MSRARLLAAALESVRTGLNHGSTGNLSFREGDGMVITPSALPWEQMEETDLVAVSLDGSCDPGARPSSEWRLHAAIYRSRADVHAVVHAHPRFATTIACLRQDLPPVHYMIAIAATDRIRCSGYALFGSEALSRATLEALGEANACLLANHGLVAVGADVEEALRVALEVEACAEYWWRACAIGDPVVLSETEMAEARMRFADYR
ncbi:MAG TPA: class II aldolase/adducin family protein [Gemmatimonadales bacterium]|nr:class II aldolase/adducin family protein [Gemmatimonadales bacterium]